MTPAQIARAKQLKAMILAAEGRIERLLKELEELEQVAKQDEEQRARETAEAEESYRAPESYDHDLEQRWEDIEDNLTGESD